MTFDRIVKYLATVILVIAAGACSVVPWSRDDTIGQPDGFPVTYTGLLPCADCPGQRWTLTLFEDLSFRLLMTYIGADNGIDRDFYAMGRWERAGEDGNTLRLTRGTEPYRQFRVAGLKRLRLLSLSGLETATNLNYDLRRMEEADLIPGPMRLIGRYRYMADAAVFIECDSGIHYPVVIDGYHLPVERAYLALRREPGEPVLLEIEGRFVMREPEPGMPERMFVKFEGPGEFRPRDICPR